MLLEALWSQMKNLGRDKTPPRPADDSQGDPYAHEEPAGPPSLAELIHASVATGALAAALPELPLVVADALRAIASGERIPAPLGPEEIALLGQTVSAWGTSFFGRGGLSPWSPVPNAPELVEHLGLPLETAQRVAAVVDWPIGFQTEDIRDFAALSEEESAQIMAYLDRAHGMYAKGVRYAAP